MKKNDKTILIRMANEPDCATITNIALAAYAMYLDRMQTKPFPMLDDYASHIQQQRVYVLEDNQAVYGYVVLMEQDANSLLLDNIAVHPKMQNMGYGRCLAKYAEDFGSKYGYSRICLYTNEVMTENLIWYQNLGYAITHRALENGYHRIYLAKNL